MTECTATFSGIATDSAYTIEVTAAGMTQNAWISVTARPITVTSFALDTADGGGMQLSWQYIGNAPQDGWGADVCHHAGRRVHGGHHHPGAFRGN